MSKAVPSLLVALLASQAAHGLWQSFSVAAAVFFGLTLLRGEWGN